MPSSSLSLPTWPIGIDDAIAEEIPGAVLKKISFLKNALMAEHEFETCWVGNQNAFRERGHLDTEGLEAVEVNAAGEPGEQFIARSKEIPAIMYNRKCIWS